MDYIIGSSIMRLLIKPYLITLVIMYLIVKYVKINALDLPIFFKNYFTDLLLMPVILMICLALIRSIKNKPLFILTPFMITYMTLFYAVFFEWYAPLISTNQTGDWIDVLMYILGGVGFWLIQKNLSKLELDKQFKG